ncbi:tetratricopeptide repeat protein [Persicirhabdus sediminis]|uniref:Tetratricopeptide repeat-containing protein n=1 Tax=Persicirhabdus sediminis TaxID=454144 RepID=A0A8J7MDM7_9BACT|nr:tetratricopeptide repeat protein [Persicirhabdus sediminis]MBK1791316.1 hypothetical protein [Persicirhabdus sediminis]
MNLKSISTALLIGLVATPAMAQLKEAANQEISPAAAFSNLPLEVREDYGQRLIEIQNLFNDKRIFDAIEKIGEAEKIFDRHPLLLNIKGACYVEIRNFDKAEEIFSDVLAIDPNNANVKFNLAEVSFVKKDWDNAEKRFTDLLQFVSEENNLQMYRLIQFKIMLSQLKNGNEDKARAVADKYDFMDDSPFIYYAKAAISYHDDEKLEAEKLLRNARFVWTNPSQLAAWQDTLIEFGYVKSFYGGDDENDPTAPRTAE